ncbi:MAG: hypothetical protein OEW15_15115 [Nitrospirota bacterium]|nr:hypothetical protein [Nitrospirota bacterium]
MPYSTRIIRYVLILAAGLAAPCLAEAQGGASRLEFPEAKPPEIYGTILIDRTSTLKGVKPVIFSHWLHRRTHTCRVCHFELEFNMKANSTEITENENRSGKYCGACHDGREHDGKVLFGHENSADCGKCHTGDLTAGSGRYKELARLPRSSSGNKVNWSKALEKGMITPQHELHIKAADMNYDKSIKLEAEWWNIPPALFPHDRHIKWLDCNNCHPDIFNIKKKTTKHFLMTRILSGEFCGVCHMTVAFPITDCRKCHPAMREQ